MTECNIQMTESGKMCTVPLQIFFSGCKKTHLLGRPQHMLHYQGVNHFSFHFRNENGDAKMLFLTNHELYCIISYIPVHTLQALNCTQTLHKTGGYMASEHANIKSTYHHKRRLPLLLNPVATASLQLTEAR